MFAFLEHLVPSAEHFALAIKALAGEIKKNEKVTAVMMTKIFFFIRQLSLVKAISQFLAKWP